MEIFKLIKENNHEQVGFYTDKSVKLRAILVVHSTALGPAMGGVRIYKYKTEEEAMREVLRLSQAMTYKTAAAGLNFGGGEVVVWEQEGMDKSEPLFRALGRFIDSFKGRFIAGEDVGVTEESMEYMAMETQYVAGLPAYYGGSGNHSYMGAYGTFLGLLAAAKHRWGDDSIEGRKILIQGYGRIGTQLAQFAKEKNARVWVTDINPEKVEKAEENGYEIVAADKAMTEKFDIVAPCAVGSVITPESAREFQCEIIAGASNNQLLNPKDDRILKERGILYAPDFIINAGAIIDISEEYLGYKEGRVKRKTENIYDRLLEILEFADNHDLSTNDAAIQFALRRIEAIKKIKGTFVGKGKV